MAETRLIMPAGLARTTTDQVRFEGLSLEPPTRDIVEVDENGDTEAVVKEEEVITKRKTELTTTRQIETRVKRQVVFEDGKVVEDSGPQISTNTTEDTDKQTTEETERKIFGNPDEPDAIEATEFTKTIVAPNNAVGEKGMLHTMVARPDGLVRNVQEQTVVSREEKKELLETEDVKHLGDFTDEAYIKAVNSGVENIRPLLLSPENDQQLVASGPRILQQTSNTHKTVDTEDTELKFLAQTDGTLVTEKKKTNQHEELFDGDLPEADDLSTGSREKVEHTESSERFLKQRNEQNVEYIANGKVIGREMRYATENQEMERNGPPISEWDSLSDRLRKAKRQQKTLLQKQKELAERDRTDALTKKPLDFDREEETRKAETSKWLESHFGSDSRSSRDSRDSRDEDIVEPTKKTYFNVTIKQASPTHDEPYRTPHPKQHLHQQTYASKMGSSHNLAAPAETDAPKTKYFQGISNWSERQTTPTKTFATKKFQDELKGTLEKNRLAKQVSAPTRTTLGEYEHRNGSRTDLRNGKYAGNKKSNGFYARDDMFDDSIQRDDSAYVSSSTYFTTPRSPKAFRTTHHSAVNTSPDSGIRSPSPDIAMDTVDEIVPPTVPQRKKALERKLKLHEGRYDSGMAQAEPPPDYSPPPKSRSISPATHNYYPTVNARNHQQQQQFGRDSNPRSIQTQTLPTSNKKTVGATIGNSLRKLVSKIRSASAERKMKFKSKRSPSPQTHSNNNKNNTNNNNNNSTYQQYNIIDGHISSSSIGGQQQQQQQQQQQRSNSISSRNQRETSVGSRRDPNGAGDRSSSYDIDMASPKQKYYLGENPYSGSIYGKENKYDASAINRNNSSSNNRERIRHRSEEPTYYTSKVLSTSQNGNASTLGRFSKSTNRLATSGAPSANSTAYRNNDSTTVYRSTQTLPRKLDHKKPIHSSTINVSIVNTVKSPPPPHNTGPAKPARTYKALNRSKSFNVHGLNGGYDDNPNPIYIEKLGRGNNYESPSFRASTQHLNEMPSQLKSPSIVNLISRSQRDLTTLNENDNVSTHYFERRHNGGTNGVLEKRNLFLKGLQDQAPELYKTLHGDEEKDSVKDFYRHTIERNQFREKEASLGSRSPITINKDTASIIRRGSSSTEDYSETYRTHTKSSDPHRSYITDTTKNFKKNIVPIEDNGVLKKETIESRRIKTVTKSHYREPNRHNSNGILIELKNE